MLLKHTDSIHDWSISDGGVINAHKHHNLSHIQQGNFLLLTDDSRNIHNTILNLYADQLINPISSDPLCQPHGHGSVAQHPAQLHKK